MLTDRLITEMGLLKLQSKELSSTLDSELSVKNIQAQPDLSQENPQQSAKADIDKSMESVKLDKNEFRLLVKMLQAIGHECTYDHISYDGQTVTYQHPKKTLVFNDITIPDTNQIINLCSLADLLSNEQFKRPVWEKLKTLKS